MVVALVTGDDLPLVERGDEPSSKAVLREGAELSLRSGPPDCGACQLEGLAILGVAQDGLPGAIWSGRVGRVTLVVKMIR